MSQSASADDPPSPRPPGRDTGCKPLEPERFDLIVVGAGHAGCEAAMAAARLGLTTLLLTISIDRIGHLSCNPAIGGLAKGHMVKEIDALGGCMGVWADQAGIQFRILNTRKGPAVRATRAQIDRDVYMRVVQQDVFGQDRLWIRQEMVDGLLDRSGRVSGVRTRLGEELHARAVLLTTGTFLRGLIHVGLNHFRGGRLGDPPAACLSTDLERIGLELGRLKTGTVPRLRRDSVDTQAMTPQPGDAPPRPFSFHSPGVNLPQVPCHLTYTNATTHAVIRSGLDRSPLYTGVIQGTGARYCPSIEDKIARFPDKDRHQVFVEPEGVDHPEVYPNGLPTSLPLEIQRAMLETIPGLEQAQIVRPGYAIEYDFVFPEQLLPTLETKVRRGLYLAGQINGTSGYEEAAAQGLWAALNIVAALHGTDPFLPGRNQAYMAVLVDDLVTKGTREPYRMFTSRAEHRLLLREGNADQRLTPLGRSLGLVRDDHWEIFTHKQDALRDILEGLAVITVRPDAAMRDFCTARGTALPGKALSLEELLRRPELHLADLAGFWPELVAMSGNFSAEITEEVENRVKYAGYLCRQEELASRDQSLEQITLPEALDFEQVAGLSSEVREKLHRVRPLNLGQAGRISGITPAALGCLRIHLRKLEKPPSPPLPNPPPPPAP
ncbi:tRNA uridine-5-carboxymethylaminomethyl(34) synthesis enzyme MnmG [Desulfonatronum thioautotrophicum]|uniref:tRNA uridine-5-carboxymethylaminomethyl(34) synthesis enzyme MnmG n=1 Tax=Desulfonatronum thioautotrophicum TaxID=617001 RepID=UPI000A0632E8|nr:tRNA uridine-5-carboxymethylaminomethyl(34) synthesis enzyme MnmG [Desulfonatronum thioautotrophicum]